MDGVGAHALNTNRVRAARGDCTERNKVTRRRRICFYMDCFWGLVRRPSRDGEALPTVALYLDAKSLQEVQGDVDIGFADEFAHYVNHDVTVFGGERQSHQQSRQKLAGDIAPYLNGLV